jgi:hypothetical protein
VLFLTKRPSGYFYDADAVRVPASANSHGGDGANPGEKRRGMVSTRSTLGQTVDAYNPAGRSLRSSDFWRTGAREAAEQLLAAADGEAVGLLTNDDGPAALVVNPKGSGIPHFAMWPARLVAPMIKASTPEAGCCSVCGAPWERRVDIGAPLKRLGSGGPVRRMAVTDAGQGTNGSGATSLGRVRAHSTLGFRPSCACNAPSRPARILDPFAGAGTTLAVAEVLGREAVGCELYQKNADLYPQRKAIIAKELARILEKPPAQVPLFEAAAE